MKRLPVLIPRSLETKVKGLLRYDRPPSGWGMLFLNVNDIHMVGMKFPIDVIFFDKNWIIRDIKTAQPGARSISCPTAAHTLEVAAGVGSKVRKGQMAKLENSMLLFR